MKRIYCVVETTFRSSYNMDALSCTNSSLNICCAVGSRDYNICRSTQSGRCYRLVTTFHKKQFILLLSKDWTADTEWNISVCAAHSIIPNIIHYQWWWQFSAHKLQLSAESWEAGCRQDSVQPCRPGEASWGWGSTGWAWRSPPACDLAAPSDAWKYHESHKTLAHKHA